MEALPPRSPGAWAWVLQLTGGSTEQGRQIFQLRYGGWRAYLQGLAQPAVEIGRVHINVGKAAVLQGPAKQGLNLLVDLLADATDLRLGDAALGSQGS